MNTEIQQALLKERPKLGAGTVKTYASLVASVLRKMESKDITDLKTRHADVLAILKDKAPSSRKTTLSALYILTGIPDYREQMMSDIDTYKAETAKQEMNEKQKDAFVSQQEIADKLNELQDDADVLMRKKIITQDDKNKIQNYILMVLVSGFFFVPRRSLDWCMMRINGDIDTAKDNYIKSGKQFVFNTYKGSAQKGQQIIDIPKPVHAILKKWMKINTGDWLLQDTSGKPLNSIKITQRLNSIFGKKASVNTLRHSYLSSKYQDSIKMNTQMQRDMEAMGSSINQKNTYIQKITII